MSTAPTILPNNLELLKAMVGELSNTVDQKDLLIHQLQHQIKALIHQKFGRKSEAIDPKELLPFIEDLFGQEDNVSSSSNKESAEDKSKPTVKEKTKGHGRKPLPAHLPRTQVIHDIPDDQKQCSCCDQLLTCIDKEVTEQLDYMTSVITSDRTCSIEICL